MKKKNMNDGMPTGEELFKILDSYYDQSRKAKTAEERADKLEECFKKLFPTFFKLKEQEAAYKNTVSYAYSELMRFYNHVNKVHKGKADECEGYEGGCTEQFDMDTYKGHTKKIYEAIEKELKEQDKDDKNGTMG